MAHSWASASSITYLEYDGALLGVCLIYNVPRIWWHTPGRLPHLCVDSPAPLVSSVQPHEPRQPESQCFNSETAENICMVRRRSQSYGPFKCYITLLFWKFDTHPPPRNANNVEPYIFVTLFSGKSDILPPPTALRNTWMALYGCANL